MKNNVIRMFLALGVTVASVSALSAQTYRLSAEIPFAFHVNDKAYQAGKYVVAENSPSGTPSLMNLANGYSTFIVGANRSLDNVKGAPSKLVFHCYNGNACFLAEIWPASGHGSSVPKTKTEKEILRAERPQEMATVYVDLHRTD